MEIFMELCLGTVQFGMDYGIRGGKKPTRAEVFEILDYAKDHHIKILDTAAGYGDAQSVIGKYMVSQPGSFEIISKLSMDLFKNSISLRDYTSAACHEAETILLQLWIPSLKGLLFHNPGYLYDKKAVAALRQLKLSGYTELIGVSVYEPKDALYALELGMDILQLPVNLFDHRFDEVIRNAGTSVKLCARSIYLQGLLLMDTVQAASKFPGAREYFIKLDNLCQNYGFTRRDIAFGYIRKKQGISTIIFGVDNLEQLRENLSASQTEIPDEVFEEIAEQFQEISEEIISPIKWNKV